MTNENYPSELVEDLSPIGVPIHLHLEELRADVGHFDSSFKNLRRTADLLLPLLDSCGIREPSDLDDPIARSRLLEVMTEEAPKGVEGQLVAGTPESLERRLSELALHSLWRTPARDYSAMCDHVVARDTPQWMSLATSQVGTVKPRSGTLFYLTKRRFSHQTKLLVKLQNLCYKSVQRRATCSQTRESGILS